MLITALMLAVPSSLKGAADVSRSAAACAVSLTGGVNLDGVITAADVIYLIGSVFRGWEPPRPCWAAADTNCSGVVTTSNMLGLVQYLF